MTTTSSNWYYDLYNPQPLRPNHCASADPFIEIDQWLGRSCGARLYTNKCDAPQVITGIVVYTGKRFEGINNTLQRISHVETKNGPLTIVEDMTHITTMRKLK